MRSKSAVPTESAEQIALFKWAKLAQGTMPELALMYAIPNGGLRSKVTAARMKAEGVKAGVPDIHLPVARGGYLSLYIELKRVKGGRVSPGQMAFFDALRLGGHRVVVCFGWAEAQQAITNYLKGSRYFRALPSTQETQP